MLFRSQDHLNVAIILNNLAKLYRAQRRYSEAEKLYLRSLFILSQGLRLDHPNVIKVKQDFINFLAQLLDEGEQSALSNDPLVQELIAQIQEERSPQPNPPST